MRKRILLGLAVLLVGGALMGCSREGCLSNEPGCRMPSPCRKVQFSCDSDTLSVRRVASSADRPGGLNALAAVDDVKLSNGFVEAVIAGIGNQNYLDPNGGSLLDLAVKGRNNDGLNQVLQVVGILPRDAARYERLEIIDEPDRVGVQVSGSLDGQPALQIHTLYELRRCDRGLRMRTEIVNAGIDTQLWALMDGFYWSKREPLPFAPGEGSGFSHPSFNLLTINEVFRRFPFMAAASASAPYSSYAHASCTDRFLEGFHSDVVSASGLSRTVVPPREYQVFERYLAVSASDDVAGAADLAFELRRQVLGETTVRLSGRVERAGGSPLGDVREVSILISEGRVGDEPSKRIPWTQISPDEQGNFSARVPAGADLLVEVFSHGQKAVEKEVPKASSDVEMGALVLPSTARITFVVTDEQTSQPIDAEIFVIPADEETREAVAGSFHGQNGTCSPYLGPPPGESPACNRILVRGQASADIPPGRFHFYAFHGPFWTLARRTETLTPTEKTLSFSLRKLPLQPPGTVTADLHVHGGASFDSSIPDHDRVLSFAASDLEVIVATDHDVVYDFGAMLRQLGLQDKMSTVTGVETTGHIPWLFIPGYAFPLVVGHYNFWPLRYDPSKPRNGGPFDEFVEPGELFDRVEKLFLPGVQPLIELNHPWAEAEFGRDLGFPRAIGLDARRDLPPSDDGTNMGVYVRRPRGGHRNDDHHAQEVMNGSQNDMLLPYRAFWFYTLNQGQLKTGTANSDSHSLVDNTVGMPRNVVWADTQAGPSFDVDRFNKAIVAGRVLGTNGPVIEATIEDESGAPRPFGFSPFKPKVDAIVRLRVSAAPWVPVEEIRFIVNGAVAKTLSNLPRVAEPFGADGLVRFEGELPLIELVSGSKDAWLVIEAGSKLPLAGDLGGLLVGGGPDGIPDTTDNNGDGAIDCNDVQNNDKNKDGKTDCADVALGAYGPLKNPAPPKDEAHPNFHFAQITDGYPMAFTNPFILDRDGNGRFDAPGAKGGN